MNIDYLFVCIFIRHSSSFLYQARKAYPIEKDEMFFSHLPKDAITDETIKLAHHLAQTPSANQILSQNKKIEQCMNTLIQLKESGAIGGGPCGL